MKKSKIDREKIRVFILDIFFGGKQYKTTSKTEKTPFPFKTVCIAAVMTALVLTLIFSLIEVSEVSSEIASLRRKTVSLATKQASLENELDHRYSIAEIIDTATALGYSEDGGRIIYIETRDPDEPRTEETTEALTQTEESSSEE